MQILGICGSLRKQSLNHSALVAAQKLAPEGVTIEIVKLDGIPPYDQDLDLEPPAAVTEFKRAIRAADAILIATPEYNYSVPGVLKNAIDWASRPYGDSAWADKPVAIMGASMGQFGTARAQYHLRQTLVFLNMHALNQPEVMIPVSARKVRPGGEPDGREDSGPHPETGRGVGGVDQEARDLAGGLPVHRGGCALPGEIATEADESDAQDKLELLRRELLRE
ncbi:MAG: NAD(P)H-dependent oxidoreductase [Acidobacteriota bacterium]